MSTFLLIHAPRTVLGLLFLVSAIDGFWAMATGNHLIPRAATADSRGIPIGA